MSESKFYKCFSAFLRNLLINGLNSLAVNINIQSGIIFYRHQTLVECFEFEQNLQDQEIASE